MVSTQDPHATSQSYLNRQDMALRAMKPGAEDVFLAPARAFDGDDFTLPIEPLGALAELFVPMPTFKEDESAQTIEHPSPESSISRPQSTEEGPTWTFNTVLRPEVEHTSEATSNSYEASMTMRHPADQKKRKLNGLFDFLLGEQGTEKRAKKKSVEKENKYQLAQSEDVVWMLVAKKKKCEDKKRRDSVIGEDVIGEDVIEG